MKKYTLEKNQYIPLPVEEVFAFFKNPENLEKLTPATVGFKILTPMPILMEKGTLIDYTIKLFGIDKRWTTLITDYSEPHRFVDEQLKGPYSFWHHTHIFEPYDGGTKITDKVEYAIGMGVLGEIVHGMFVKKQLQKIFNYRNEVIGNYFKNKTMGGS